jgi:superfamily II DNA or RNA helicase
MQILVGNKIRIIGGHPGLLNYFKGALRTPNPKFTEAQDAGRSTWGIPEFIDTFEELPDSSIRIPRGKRPELMKMCEDLRLAHTVRDDRAVVDIPPVDSTHIQYRPYQFDAVLKLTTGGDEGVLTSPAGSGKTVMGLSLIPLLNQRTLWLTHTGPLVDQALDRASSFLHLGPDDMGLIGRGKWTQGKVLTVATIQTLVRNLNKAFEMRDDYGLILLDEAHHCPATTFLQVVGQFRPYYLYGLTATPYRRDRLEKIMFDALGPELVRVDLEDVKRHGGIIMPTVYYRAVRTHPIPGVTDGNNFSSIVKNYIVPNAPRNHMIVGDVLREAAAGNYCIVISDRKAHCELLHDLISIGWPKTGIATGNYSRKYVAEQVSRFEKDEISVLVATYSLLGEGFDVKKLNRGFVACPFRAENKAEQLIGRLQRTSPETGKTDAVVYDYVDVDVGVLHNQFNSPRKDCRLKAYERLGVQVLPYE